MVMLIGIPEGTQTGKKFRLRGKGAPSLRGGAVGDQYVTVNVVTPTGLNDRQKAALKEFAAAGELESKSKEKKASLTNIKRMPLKGE